MSKKNQGVVKQWNSSRGFGFIEVGTYLDVVDYFFHISSWLEEEEPQQGDCVAFQLVKDPRKGNFVASEVQTTGEYIEEQYFSPEYRREIRRNLKKEAQQRQQQQRERYMESEQFKNAYFYQRKQGYFCRRCRRQFDYNSKTFECSCQNDDYYW